MLAAEFTLLMVLLYLAQLPHKKNKKQTYNTCCSEASDIYLSVALILFGLDSSLNCRPGEPSEVSERFTNVFLTG